jgi:hypothetical protein
MVGAGEWQAVENIGSWRMQSLENVREVKGAGKEMGWSSSQHRILLLYVPALRYVVCGF